MFCCKFSLSLFDQVSLRSSVASIKCRSIKCRITLVANWLITQILFSLKPSTCKCSIMGTNGPRIAFVDLSSLFCFRSRGSILLPSRKLSEFIIIYLIICQLPHQLFALISCTFVNNKNAVFWSIKS